MKPLPEPAVSAASCWGAGTRLSGGADVGTSDSPEDGSGGGSVAPGGGVSPGLGNGAAPVTGGSPLTVTPDRETAVGAPASGWPAQESPGCGLGEMTTGCCVVEMTTGDDPPLATTGPSPGGSASRWPTCSMYGGRRPLASMIACMGTPYRREKP